MNTRMLALAVCCLSAAGLAACSSDQSAAPPPPAPAPVAAPAPQPPPPSAIPSGLTPAQQKVAQLQTELNAAGAQLTVDGKMGSATRTALRDFQKQHHLKVTGRPDAATMKALSS